MLKGATWQVLAIFNLVQSESEPVFKEGGFVIALIYVVLCYFLLILLIFKQKVLKTHFPTSKARKFYQWYLLPALIWAVLAAIANPFLMDPFPIGAETGSNPIILIGSSLPGLIFASLFLWPLLFLIAIMFILILLILPVGIYLSFSLSLSDPSPIIHPVLSACLLAVLVSWEMEFLHHSRKKIRKERPFREKALKVDFGVKKQILPIGDISDLTLSIKVKKSLFLQEVKIHAARGGQFKILKIFGELPISLSAGSSFNMTFQVLGEKVGETPVKVKATYKISEKLQTTQYSETPLLLSIRSPPPKLSSEGTLISSLSTGRFEVQKTVKLTVHITNLGDGEARNVRLDLSNLLLRKFRPFEEPQSLIMLKPGADHIFDIPGVFLKSGKCHEKMSVHADDLHGTNFSWTVQIPQIYIEKILPSLEVILSGPRVIELNEIAEYQLQITNGAEGLAKDLLLKWLLPKQVTFISGVDSIKLGDLSFNETKTVTIRLKFPYVRNYSMSCALEGTDIEGIKLPHIESKEIPIEITQKKLPSTTTTHQSIIIHSAIDRKTVTEKFSTGKVFTVKELTGMFKCRETEIASEVKERLQSSASFVTREGDIIRIEEIQIMCQIYMISSPAEKFYQCIRCNRHICHDHFVSITQVGRSNCPHCEGVLIFLPKTCPMCSIDYLMAPKSPNYCNFCGYRLTYPEHLKIYVEESERLLRDSKNKKIDRTTDNNSKGRNLSKGD